jgi:hypothetical protein
MGTLEGRLASEAVRKKPYPEREREREITITTLKHAYLKSDGAISLERVIFLFY